MYPKKSKQNLTSEGETLEVFVFDCVQINEPAQEYAARIPVPVFIPEKEPGFARLLTPLTAILVAPRPPTSMKMIFKNLNPVLV